MATVFGAESKILFWMNCQVTKIPAVGNPQKIVFNTWSYQEVLSGLIKKWYTRIDLIKNYTINGQQIEVLFGQKCGHDVVRINGQESINDIGVDHIERNGNTLLLYGAKDKYATMITCDLSNMTGNAYVPFDGPSQISWKTGVSLVQSGRDFLIPQDPKVAIQQWITLHPQDKFQLFRQPVSVIIKSFGGTWKQQRQQLAQILGIKNYQWSKAQNLRIRAYLLSKIHVVVNPTTTSTIKVPSSVFAKAQTDIVANIAHLRSYTRKYDRRGLFAEIGNNTNQYVGTKNQNLQIRKYLLNKMTQ